MDGGSKAEFNPMHPFLHVYHQNLPVVIFTMTSIVYVHVVSRFIRSTGQWGLIAFSTASIALKLLLQEVAKHVMIIVHRPVSRRVMVALVSTPTILVDTQVRILLLRQDNLKISLAGTALIAVFEVGVRATKSVIVQRQTCVPLQKSQRRFSSIDPQTKLKQNTRIKSQQQVDVLGSTDSGQWISNTAVQSRLTSTGETPAEYKARRNEMERRQKIRVLHAGEIYADMYAEYIAIGCSFAILYFFRFHPQYDFSILVSGASDYFSRSTDAGSISRDRQLVYLGYLQMGVEVVVDFVACTLEATRGVELKSFDQNDPFLIFFMVMLTFSNIGISARLYMH
ncbi:unnamed protein product [Phytophthora lilii]|uniref:Unnamed protein product n=1 Tax=Phytophthora lilii TaxID=2077276 RepID=A0A9W6WN63_9STRA|nr:unnamed protein product [Phytophthora lilii]